MENTNNNKKDSYALLVEALELAHKTLDVVRIFEDGEIVESQSNISYDAFDKTNFVQINSWNVEDYFEMSEEKIIKEFGSEEEAIKDAIWDMKAEGGKSFFEEKLAEIMEMVGEE
jgi:hypothetical protein